MISEADLQELAESKNLLTIGVRADEVRRRLHGTRTTFVRVFEIHVEAPVSALPPRTSAGEFRIVGFRSLVSAEEFVVLMKGELRPDKPSLVRIHSQCMTGDVFGSIKCDCGRQLSEAMKLIDENCSSRTENVPVEMLGGIDTNWLPTEVTHGGATVFVLPLEEIRRI